MELKIKKTISLLAVCMLVFVSLSAVMVYAPPPSDGVTPFQNVIIANPDPIPVDVTTATTLDVALVSESQPFQCEINLEMVNDQYIDNASPDEPVPAGKIFVIEYISASAISTNNNYVWLDIITQIGGQEIVHPFHSFEIDGIHRVSISREAKLYSDDSGSLEAWIWRNDGADWVVSVHVTFSGYLIDAS